VAGLTLACSIQQVCVDCQTGWLRLNTRGSSRLCPSDPFIPASIRVDRRHRAECGLGFRVCYVCCTGYGFGVGGMNRSNGSGCSRSGTQFCNLEAAIGRHCRQLPRRRGGGAIGPGRLRSWTRTGERRQYCRLRFRRCCRCAIRHLRRQLTPHSARHLPVALPIGALVRDQWVLHGWLQITGTGSAQSRLA
jgi:hypothetical protein